MSIVTKACMDSQTIVIQLPGSGPYGFRLIGGEAVPLTVSKIRPYSKAQKHGICEGDIVLGINGICSKGLKHSIATGLTDSDSQGITLHVIRHSGGNSEEVVQRALEELRGQLRFLSDNEASQLLGPPKVIPISNPVFDSPPDSPVSSGSKSAPFKLQLPPIGGFKQMRNYHHQLSRDSNTSSPVITNINTMNKQCGQLNLQQDLGNPAGDDKGYYSRNVQTFQEGDITRKVTEEVSKDRYGGTTVTRIVKQEVANRQIPMNERIMLDQPTFSIMAGPQKFGRTCEVDGCQDDEIYGSNLPNTGQAYNRATSNWETSSINPQRSGGGQSYDFATMIQELENSAPKSWEQTSAGTNKGGTHHWNTTTSWTVGNGGSNERGQWNGSSSSSTVEMRPGSEIQIQFQPRPADYGSQSSYNTIQNPAPAYYQSTGPKYPYASSYQPSSSQPLIQMYSSNEDRPHVQLQTNLSSVRKESSEDKPFMTEEYVIEKTKRYQTEEQGPVTIKSWSSNEPSGGQKHVVEAPVRSGVESNSCGEWGENNHRTAYGRDGEVLVRNNTVSLSNSPSVQGSQPWKQMPTRPSLRQINVQSPSKEDEKRSFSSWQPNEIHVYQDSAREPLIQSQKLQLGSYESQCYPQGSNCIQGNSGFDANQRAPPYGQQIQWGSQGQQIQSWSQGPQQQYQRRDEYQYGPSSQQNQQLGKQSHQSDHVGYPQQSCYLDNSGYGYRDPQQDPQQTYQISSSPQGYQKVGSRYPGYQNEGPQGYAGYQLGGPQGYQQSAPQQWSPQGYSPNYHQWDPHGCPQQPNPHEPQQGFEGYKQDNKVDHYECGRPAPPPPPPPPIAPPPHAPASLASNKNLYGPQAVPERIQVAKVVAHSVLAPENSNSKGQQMFLKRMAQSEKWSTRGDTEDFESGSYGGGYQSSGNTSSWTEQSGSCMREQSRPELRQLGIGVGLSSDEMAEGGGRGGQLFAKKKERANRWAAADDHWQAGRGTVIVGTAIPQQQQQEVPSNCQPMKIASYSGTLSQQYGGPSNPKYAYTDL